ncbi:MAG: NUDIX domain-containing protein [Saprospiraceae bacterium]
MPSYLQQLRQLIGNRRIIYPAARIIIENEQGEVLFIRRIDNGKWGIPAGGFEQNETIEACIRREVQEEVNIELLDLQVIGIATHPQQETVIYPNGDEVQYFTIEFYSNNWRGTPQADNVETKEVIFQPFDFYKNLPANEQSTFLSLEYFRKNGQVRLF